MASDINPSLTPTKSLSNFRFWCQKVLPLVYDDSLSYYEVLGKMVVQLNDVIDDVNADTENVLTLKDAFLELQDYVNNFFDDIDQLVSYTERAEAAQTAANQSAINAASSASNASASSLAAMDAKDAAVTAKQAAETSANTASTAASNANTKASEAAQSAVTAQTAQASASQSATLAATDRSAAQTAASTATTKANEASQSADNAAQSEANAETLVNRVEESLENIQQNTQDIIDLNNKVNDQIIISPTQPVSENNKLWIDSDETSVQIPTYAEYLATEKMPSSVTGAWCTVFSSDQIEEITVARRKFRKRLNAFLLQTLGGTSTHLAINLTGTEIIPYTVENASGIALRASDIVLKSNLVASKIKFFKATTSNQSYFIILTCDENLSNQLSYAAPATDRGNMMYVQDLTDVLADANTHVAIYYYSNNLSQSTGYHAFDFE